MPSKLVDEPSKVQGFVSTWAMDSFFAAFLSANPVEFWFRSTDALPDATFKLSTDELATILPGIKKAYGSQPVDVLVKAEEVDDVHITEANSVMGAFFTVTLDFWCNNTSTNVPELAASITLKDTEFSFSALVDNMSMGM